MAIKKGLGKGLGALISPMETASDENQAGTVEIDILKIEPGIQQPRKYFDEKSLRELAESMKQYGIIQPIIVKKEEGGFYSIIAGERRYRAARMAKLDTIPAIVKDYNESERLQIALIENIQRQDLNPIEEALCFKRLAEDYFFTQEDIAEKIGKSRSAISNALSLLNLDLRVQDYLIDGRIATSHARMLLFVKDGDKQLELAERIVNEDLRLSELEKIIKREEQENKAPPKQEDKPRKYGYLEEDLKNILGTKVNIIDGKNKGRIEIEYYSEGDLDRLLGMFKEMIR